MAEAWEWTSLKRIIDQLGGELSMETSFGTGTTFTLRIPLSVTIVDAFTVQCGAECFAVPVSMVDEILAVEFAKVTRGPGRRGVEGTALLERRGEAVPLVDLSRLVGLSTADTGPGHPRQALVVYRGSEAVAFGLDRVLAQQETVVRPLVDPLVQVTGIVGSTDLGDGKPTLVLDLAAMVGTFDRPQGDRAGHAA